MADLTTLDPTKPADGDLASQGASRMREERADILGWSDLEHNRTGTHKTYYALVQLNVDQSIPNGLATPVSWPGATINNGALWAAGNPTRLTAVVAGTYQLSGQVAFESAAVSTSIRGMTFRINSLIYTTAWVVPAVAGRMTLALNWIVALNPNDYVEMLALQNSSAPVNVLAGTVTNGFGLLPGTAGTTSFYMNRIGSA